MNLERTERNLTRMQELADPALEDVLNYIYDFCQDVKDDTGSAVDHLDCRDEDAMYRRLPWLGRTVSRLGAKLAPEVGEESRKARLEELSGELETLAAQVEAAERENSDALGRQHALEAEITAQNTALEEKNRKISGLEGELESLKQQSADLDERIKLSPFTTNVTDDLTSVYAYYPSGNVRVENPFFQRRYQDKYLMDYDLFVNMFARITLPFGFEFQTNYSPRLHWYQYANHNSSENPLWGLTRAQSTRSNRTTLDWQLDNTLSWKKEFGDHRFEVTLAQNAEQNKVWFTNAKAKDFALADQIREELRSAGIELTDLPTGVTWKRV